MLSLLSRLDQTSAWYVELQLYVVAARVGGNVMSPNMTVWYRGARLVHLSPTGWSGVWQSPCWNSRNSRIQQFLKPFDQLHRFWFENLSDINPLAKILNPSQNLSFLSLRSYYWLRPRYGSYHWVLLNPFVFVSHDISYFGQGVKFDNINFCNFTSINLADLEWSLTISTFVNSCNFISL